MKILVVFNFETGDRDCRYWQETRVVQCDKEQLIEIEDCFSSYLDSELSEDKEYEDMVDEVLSSTNLQWSNPINIPECDYMHTFWI